MMTKYILYACPVGPLASRISAYFIQARARHGHNPAQDYVPHISLTGFFRDDTAAVAGYVSTLETLLREFGPTRPSPMLSVTRVRFDEQFHGLEFENTLASSFAETRLEFDRATYLDPSETGQILAVFDVTADTTEWSLHASHPLHGYQVSIDFRITLD